MTSETPNGGSQNGWIRARAARFADPSVGRVVGRGIGVRYLDNKNVGCMLRSPPFLSSHLPLGSHMGSVAAYPTGNARARREPS